MQPPESLERDLRERSRERGQPGAGCVRALRKTRKALLWALPVDAPAFSRHYAGMTQTLFTDTEIPQDPVDLYDDAVIRAPWTHYARLRAKGPVVWLSRLQNYAFTQYAVVRQGLRDHETFVSGKGVAADDFGCSHLRGNTVASDPPRHGALRGAMMPPLLPAAIAQIKPRVQSVADALVERCLDAGSVDAIPDLAQGLPLAVVRDLVGLPDFGRANMLKWAGAAFDVLGVQNARGQAAQTAIAEMRSFIARNATPDKLKPGSWTHRITEMARSGKIDAELAPFALRDYINPSLDTTISAIGHLLYHLGRDPTALDRLRTTPALRLNAAHEAVRIGTPIRAFSRHTVKPVDIAGHRLPAGARVMMLFASANRDETVFAAPDRFAIDRANARRHLGFGAGIHMCVGMHLALLEIECLINALVARCQQLETGAATPAMNNSICAHASLPMTIR